MSVNKLVGELQLGGCDTANYPYRLFDLSSNLYGEHALPLACTR